MFYNLLFLLFYELLSLLFYSLLPLLFHSRTPSELTTFVAHLLLTLAGIAVLHEYYFFICWYYSWKSGTENDWRLYFECYYDSRWLVCSQSHMNLILLPTVFTKRFFSIIMYSYLEKVWNWPATPTLPYPAYKIRNFIVCYNIYNRNDYR